MGSEPLLSFFTHVRWSLSGVAMQEGMDAEIATAIQDELHCLCQQVDVLKRNLPPTNTGIPSAFLSFVIVVAPNTRRCCPLVCFLALRDRKKEQGAEEKTLCEAEQRTVAANEQQIRRYTLLCSPQDIFTHLTACCLLRCRC
jgi:hypothetical protein